MMKLLLKRLNEEKIALRRKEGGKDKRRPPPKAAPQNDKNRAGAKSAESLCQKTKEENNRGRKTDQRRSRCGN
jgi:hypothetical protein